MRDELRRLTPLVTWGITLAVAIVLFTLLGDGQLAAPPLTDPGAWGDWVGDREPVVATVAILRLVVLALAWYLVGVTTIGAVARLADIAALVRLADALSIPLVRRVLQSSLGVGLATAVVSSAVAPAVVAGPPSGRAEDGTTVATAAALADDRPDHPGDPVGDELDGPSMRALAADPSGDAPAMEALPPTAGAAPHMQALGEGPPPPGMRPLPEVVDAVPDPAPPAEAQPAPSSTHTVVAGDHLWSIAEAHLARTTGDVPSDAAVAEYWERLVEANRDRLVDRDNPDLIRPGQQFVLPDVETTA